MATIKLKFRPSLVPGKEGTLYYQVNYRHRTFTISTAYHIHPHEWDKRHAAILTTASIDDNARLTALQFYASATNGEMNRMKRIVKEKDSVSLPSEQEHEEMANRSKEDYKDERPVEKTHS